MLHNKVPVFCSILFLCEKGSTLRKNAAFISLSGYRRLYTMGMKPLPFLVIVHEITDGKTLLNINVQSLPNMGIKFRA